jgi:hypothetical protein
MANACRGHLEADGVHVTIDLEPEPGCVLETAEDVVSFFERYVWALDDHGVAREHIGVCHDVCHAAVMFEDQMAVLGKYRNAGIKVGKVQVSAALRMDLDLFEPPSTQPRAEALAQLSSFAEDRYLHQTVVRRGAEDVFYEDLHLALDAERDDPRGEWRVHFHVPIYVRDFGRLHSTQDDVGQCLRGLAITSDCQHFEVETYAWGVLPPELAQPDLAAGIAEELRWFEALKQENENLI